MSPIASPAAILRASKAVRGGGQQTPAPQGSYPWIGQLPQYSAQPQGDYARAYGPPFLPRPPETFTSGAFGPFSPILPVPIDQPPPGFQRPQPRRWQYPVGIDLPVGEPGSDGMKLASFASLKTLSRLYSIVRQCIEIRKNEIRALDWDIVLTQDAAKAYQGDRKAMRDWGERQQKLKKWFKKPDPNYASFSSFLNTMLDQVFTIDALSLYLSPTMDHGRSGKGLLGSGLDSLWLLDGAGIRPMVGLHGEVPRPPAVGYQQYEYGVPRADLMSMRDGRDLIDAGFTEGDLTGQWRGDQLLYLPWLQQADTIYGFSAVERCLIPIMTGLQKQAYQLNYFTEGTVPAVYVSPGDTAMTPNQIRELQDALNAFAGDQAWYHKVIVLPPGSKTMPQKQMEIVDQADEWIATEVAMALDITPMELGILPKISTVASPFAAREMAQASRTIHQRISTKPTLSFFQDIFNLIIQDVAGCTDTRFLFSGMEEVQDQAAVTDMGVKQVQSGIRSIDEFRDILGLTPWDLPETSEPVVFTQMGPIPLAQAQDYIQAQMNGQSGGSGSGKDGGSGKKKPSSSSNGTGAHAAAQGGARALPAGASGTGRMNGPVTQRQARRGGSLAPAHAMAEGAPGRSGGKPVPKAAAAELEALARHLRKGRAVSTWEPVHVPAHALAVISEDLAKGLSVDQAVDIARTVVLGSGDYEWADKAANRPKERHRGQESASQQQQAQAQQQQAQQQARQAQAQALAQQYATRIQQAFATAAGQAARLIAQWASGALTVTLAALVLMIADLIRKALARVLRALWRKAWRLGRDAAEDAAGDRLARSATDEALKAFLATVGEHLAGLISGTQMTALLKALTEAVQAGEDPQKIADLLERILQVVQRAEMIAWTEVMRAMNAAAMAVYKLLGISYRTWETRRDGRVCAACLGNQNQGPVPLSAPFQSGALAPPQHPRCFPAGVVVTGPSALAATARRYEGDLVTVVFADGQEVPVTPNHPVLTPDGWVVAGDLCQGSQVLRAVDAERVAARLYPDDRQTVARIEDVAAALGEVGPVLSGLVPLSPEDFHGDGAGDDYVQVVGTTRYPVGDVVAEIGQECPQCGLVGAPGNATLGDGDLAALLIGDLAPARGLVGAVQHDAPVGSRGTLPAELHGLGAVTPVNASIREHAVDRIAINAEPARDRLHRLSAEVRLDEPIRDGGAVGPDVDAQLNEHAPEGLRADAAHGRRLAHSLAPLVSLDRVAEIRWCRDWSGHVYNLETVDGWYFANGIIAHNCRCWILPAFPPPSALTGKALRRQVDLNGQVTLHDAAEPQENAAGSGGSSPRPHITTGNGAQADIPGGVPGATAGGEPPRWDGSEVEPIVAGWVDGGDDGQQMGGPRGTGTPPAGDWPSLHYMDGYWDTWPQGGIGTGQAPMSSPGGSGPRGRPPGPTGKAANPAHVSAQLEGEPVPARKVYDQLLQNFPPSVLKWVLKATWRLCDVPQDMIDYADEDKWAAAHQPSHVAEFARDFEAGRHVDPPVMVDEPGHAHLIVADGRHRTLAQRKLKRPTVRAYVGTVAKRGGPWLRIYQRQEHGGSSPQNKSFTAGNLGIPGAVSGLTPFNLLGQGNGAKVSKQSVNYRPADPAHFKRRCGTCVMFSLGSCSLVEGKILPTATCDRWEPREGKKAAKGEPYVAGLMVRAEDTGRVLMLQRALDDDQDHAAGKWEPPGGHCEPGETLLQGALREFAEEVGFQAPRGTLTGSWTSGDGVYRGHVLTVPSEDAVDLEHGRDQVQNPDGDSFEVAAWMDPADFGRNPMLRPEMQRDLLQVMAALNGASATKGAKGSAEILREYWTREGHPGPTQYALEEKIRWGEPDDWYRCHAELTPYLGAEGAKGYCNLRHHEVLGYWPAQHARMEREGKA